MPAIVITAEDIAFVIDSILHGDDDGFEEVLNRGFDEIDQFADTLRESGRTFTLTTYP